MKQRITYVVHNPNDFDPSQLRLSPTNNAFTLDLVNAAKEHQLTFGLSELPQELYRVLRQCHELHIRWASEKSYTSIPPYVSRISPGLHAFFTPHKGSPADLLCPMLKKVFGDNLKCESPKDTFIGMPILSERFSMSSASQYYQLLPSLKDLVTYIQQKICATSDPSCQTQAASLLSATYVDIDFDTISHALVFNGFWDRAPDAESWTETISLRQETDHIEVGVLTSEKAIDPEDLAFSGFLTVIGKDSKPSPTRFSFPARHHPLPSSAQSTPPLTYTTSFRHPTGLHPALLLTFPSASLIPPDETCALHTYLTLPAALFIDRYQLSDPLFLSSLHLTNLRSLSGATDLEAPIWVVPEWGSAALLELAVPLSSRPSSSSSPASKQDAAWTVQIPLHLRYLPPNRNASGLEAVAAPWPVVFWACRGEEGAKMAASPFDRVNLGYEGLFGPKTMFYHVPPANSSSGGRLVEEIQVPVLDLDQAWYVEWGTVVAVVLGTLWVCWKLFGIVRRDVVAAKKVEGKKMQ